MSFDRRALLAGAAAALASASGAAQAQSAGPLGEVTVDVGPLRAKGLGPYAEQVRAVLDVELRRAFADRMARGGPRLVVRVDDISLNSWSGSESRPLGGIMQSDYLQGEALVVGPRGQVLLRHPQLSAVPSSSGGAWYLPDTDRRRLVALAAHFAGWLRRSLG